MMRFVLALSVLFLAEPSDARPLITSSEETAARVCLAREGDNQKLQDVCRDALTKPGLTTSLEVDLHLVLGDLALEIDDAEAARRAFQQALDLKPDSAKALNGLGWAAREDDDHETAQDYFLQSTQIRATSAGFAGLGASMADLRQAPLDDVLEKFEIALTIAPDFRWALRERGWILYRNDRFDDAVASFDRAIAINDEDQNAHYGKARTFYAQDDWDAALLAVGQAVAIDPEDGWAVLLRSQILRAMDRNAQALRDADRALGLIPHVDSAWTTKARAQLGLQQRAEAIETYQEGEAAGIDTNHFYYWYADALTEDDRFEDALIVVEKAVQADGAEAADFELKAFIALVLKNYVMADEAAQKALELDDQRPYSAFYRSVAVLHSGSDDAWKPIFQQARDLGLPDEEVGFMVRELIDSNRFLDAIALRSSQ